MLWMRICNGVLRAVRNCNAVAEVLCGHGV